jgi:regulator of protease activity HflC (stomatin/prohibitin superfamily)
MTPGLTKLIEVFLEIWWWFIPWRICNHYERGVVLRFGNFQREISAGWVWIIPFGIEDVLKQNVKPDGYFTKNQTVMLTDGTQISVSSVVIWEVTDAKRLLLEVEDIDTVLNATLGYIADFLGAFSFKELQNLREYASESGKRHGVREKLLKYINGELESWAGVRIYDVRLADLAVTGMKHGTLRVML